MLDNVQLTLVESTAELGDFLRWLGERRPVMGLDTETTGLSLGHDRIRMVQFGDARQGWSLPYDEWRGAIREVLTRYEGKYVLQHAKFDAGFLLRDGLPFPWEQVHDTMLMSFLVDSLGPKSLKPAAALYVDPRARAGEAELKQAMRKNRWGYADIPTDFPIYWGYAALDAVLTAQLAETIWPRVQYARGAYDLELACERVLCAMELRGVAVDLGYVREKLDLLYVEQAMAYSELGDLNPNAPQQVAEALIKEGVNLTQVTEKGQWSVTDDVLKRLEEQGSETAGKVRRARDVTKVIGTYFENFLSHENDGLLHPHINQLQARTGRMSVTQPALQTLPRDALVRDAFVARPGNKLVLIDADNEELRMAAHFSGDENMLAAFERGEDLHNKTAEALYGPDFTRKQRSTAKNAMFSKAYGAGVSKFAITAGVPESEAQAVFSMLARLYPRMDSAMADVTRVVRGRDAGDGYGYVKAIDGRRLRVRSDKAYVGFNALIQGSCAVVLKQGLVDLDAAGFGEFLVLPVHDEVVMDVPEDLVEEVTPQMIRTLTRKDFRVPLTWSSKTVDRWGDPYRGI